MSAVPEDPEAMVQITVDGTALCVPAHRTVAAALVLEGEASGWRTTRIAAARRGMFCGIGVCYDCLATVDDRPGMRTCLVEVVDGMVVSTEATDA
jgi:D-hydroxyproline dehydrogenase subunit gamma